MMLLLTIEQQEYARLHCLLLGESRGVGLQSEPLGFGKNENLAQCYRRPDDEKLRGVNVGEVTFTRVRLGAAKLTVEVLGDA
jgi:hypothetical protein